jgi:hypothetical protein
MSSFTRFDPGSILEIRQIHNKAEAIENKIYYGRAKDGSIHIYRGTNEGRLKEETELINAENSIDVNIENIDINKEDISNIQIQVNKLEETKADKCQAIAWSIVF